MAASQKVKHSSVIPFYTSIQEEGYPCPQKASGKGSRTLCSQALGPAGRWTDRACGRDGMLLTHKGAQTADPGSHVAGSQTAVLSEQGTPSVTRLTWSSRPVQAALWPQKPAVSGACRDGAEGIFWGDAHLLTSMWVP